VIRSIREFIVFATSCWLLAGVAVAGAETAPIIVNVAEDARPGTFLGALPQPDGGVGGRFEIVGGNDLGVFQLDVDGGLKLAPDAQLDFEERPLHILHLRVRTASPLDAARLQFATDLLKSDLKADGVAELFVQTTPLEVHVLVADVNEPPTISEQHLTVVDEEGRTDGDVFVEAVDEDHGEPLRFTLISGGAEAGIDVDAESGRLIVLPRDDSARDGVFTYPLTMQVADSKGQSDAATIYVRRIDVRDPKIEVPEPTPAAAPFADLSPMTSSENALPPEENLGNAETATAPVAVDAQGLRDLRTPRISSSRDGIVIAWYWHVLSGFLIGFAFAAVVIRRRVKVVSQPEKAPVHPFERTNRPPPRPIYVVPHRSEGQRQQHPELAVRDERIEDQLADIRQAVAQATTTAPAESPADNRPIGSALRTKEEEAKSESRDAAAVVEGSSSANSAVTTPAARPSSVSTPSVTAVATVDAGPANPPVGMEHKINTPAARQSMPVSMPTRAATTATRVESTTPIDTVDTNIGPVPATPPTPALPQITGDVSPMRAPIATPRIDRDAVREELSSLRAVANEYARATFAQQSIERQARKSWMTSANCMAGLTVAGALTVSFADYSLLRSFGWLLLGGSVASFGFCLHYFKQIALHEGDTPPDPTRTYHPADLEMSATVDLSNLNGQRE